MSATVKNTSSHQEVSPLTTAGLIKDLLVTAIISFVILTPIAVFGTKLKPDGLVWEFRWQWPLILLLAVVGYRLFMHLFVWNKTDGGTKSSPKVAAGPSSFAKNFNTILLLVSLALPFVLLAIGNKESFFPGWDKRGIDFFITVLIYIMLGWGLNVVVGLAGLLDLGYVAFFAVGAYAYALLTTQYLPLWMGDWIVPYTFYITLPLAGILAALWGIVLGFPVLRLRGDYLAIVTLAFGEIIRLVLINWFDFTSGPQGINVPKVTFFGLPFKDGEGTFSSFFGLQYDRIHFYIFIYYLILALALVTYFVTNKLRRLPLGRAWEALREDEIACRSLGINTTNTKLTAFAIGAMFGGFAGSFFSAKQGFVSPESFTFIESALILAIVVLGGLGSQIGIVFAAFAIVGSFELFRELGFLSYILPEGVEPVQLRMLAVGIALVIMMRYKPRGFVSTREPTAFLKEKKTVSADLVAQGHG
jgi:branched-chain amino acid transport system permease protein